ncbi:uncharacterized protein LOC143915845 [Arctopsyche grandis]|uniref:uncharacterized protein LOC143915845 n=1 Tax=Arctopsyche grandis TaxID=121162 RepID=UPI00406D98BD
MESRRLIETRCSASGNHVYWFRYSECGRRERCCRLRGPKGRDSFPSRADRPRGENTSVYGQPLGLPQHSKVKMILKKCVKILFITIISLSVLENYPTKPKKDPIKGNCSSKDFGVVCDGVNVNDLTSILEKEVQNFTNGKGYIEHLTIKDLFVENKTLAQNWIDTKSFRILNLSIEAPKIGKIENSAFEGYVFEELNSLSLVSLNISTLEEGTFKGLQFLKVILIKRSEIHQIKKNVLRGMAQNLTKLYVEEMICPLDIYNLIGTIPLPNLTTVTIINNNIESIKNDTFCHVKNVEIVQLYSNKIEDIGCGNFHTKSLKLLDLSSNNLNTLEPCIFFNHSLFGINGSLFVSNNEWSCNCDLYWLKQLRAAVKTIDDPKCASHSNKSFENVIFCKKESSGDKTKGWRLIGLIAWTNFKIFTMNDAR